jgi:hypothetical protein
MSNQYRIEIPQPVKVSKAIFYLRLILNAPMIPCEGGCDKSNGESHFNLHRKTRPSCYALAYAVHAHNIEHRDETVGKTVYVGALEFSREFSIDVIDGKRLGKAFIEKIKRGLARLLD